MFKGRRQKKTISYGPVRKVLAPPPSLSGKNRSFAEFWKKINALFAKFQYFMNISEKMINRYPCKNVAKYFCIFFRFRTLCIFSIFLLIIFSDNKQKNHKNFPLINIYWPALNITCIFFFINFSCVSWGSVYVSS